MGLVETDRESIAIAIGSSGLEGDAPIRRIERRRHATQNVGDIPACDRPGHSPRLGFRRCVLPRRFGPGRPLLKILPAADPVGERLSPPAVPSNPNSRLGRLRSPFAQGWDQMDAMVIGIDVSKDRLDVAVRPTGESLIFKRTGMGIEDLIARLGALSPKMVAIEATGGFEAVVAAGGRAP